MREAEVVNDGMKSEVGEELEVVSCSCGCVVEIDETTGQAYGNTCEVEKVEEDVAGNGAEEVAVGDIDDGCAAVEQVGEENGIGEVMVERRARKWKHREYVVLLEAYRESLLEGDKG